MKRLPTHGFLGALGHLGSLGRGELEVVQRGVVGNVEGRVRRRRSVLEFRRGQSIPCLAGRRATAINTKMVKDDDQLCLNLGKRSG